MISPLPTRSRHIALASLVSLSCHTMAGMHAPRVDVGCVLLHEGRGCVRRAAYLRRNLLGTFAAYRNVEEVAIRVPGTICWDQLAVPWVANRKRLDLIFNPKFTVPLLGRTRKILVLHGSEWFVIPEHFPWFGCRFSWASFKLHARTADAIITVSNAVKRDVLAHTGIDPAKLVPM